MIRLATVRKASVATPTLQGVKAAKKNSLNTLEASADESVAASDRFGRADDEVDRNVGDLGNALDIVVLHGVAKRVDPDCVLV